MKCRFALLLLTVAGSAVAQDVVVRDAWIREAPPNARVLAGYATIANPGPEPVRIVAAAARGFDAVEMHRMSHEDGVMRMRPLPAIDVPAGGEAVLSPGGDHLMLMRPARAMRAGDTVRIEFELENGASLIWDFEVRRGQ